MVTVVMETVVVVAIGVLGVVFFASLLGLLVVLRHRYCKPIDLFSNKETAPDAHLVDNIEGVSEDPSEVELDHVGTNTNLEEIIENQAWVNDATGLAPHCLAILRTCHVLTDRLVGMTMGTQRPLHSPETLTELVSVARRIGPRVDHVVRALYPPLDPRLLEARCTALVLSVSHLVLLTKSACRLSGVLDWIDQSLADVEDHLIVLREASAAYEMTLTSSQEVVGQPATPQQANPRQAPVTPPETSCVDDLASAL